MTFLKVSGLRIRKEEGFALNDVSFSQAKLQKIAIAGETGSGKSSLLKAIAGLNQPDEGEVFFHGERVLGAGEKLVPGHPAIGYLSQHFELPKSLRIEQVLQYANKIPDTVAHTLYDVCEITHVLSRKTDHLSGGERQRVALAKLLIGSPQLLLLDEPFTNLDMVHKNILKSVIDDIGHRLNITCMLVSHDPADTLPWADQIIILKDGQIVQKDSPQNIYRRPVNAYAAGLFGTFNLLTPSQSNRLSGGVGQAPAPIARPEDLCLSRTDNTGWSGTVKAIRFFGSHREIVVALAENALTIAENVLIVKASADSDFRRGEKVFVVPAQPNPTR
ncbi:ABC transporter ATP-binding protein [Chryseolinea soli]|uniref:ABC transporter ATP-binding protein n=1 Tax=Chryseolinea soli TaxID=2321403 RepID=A0A385SZC5_9BACT|nr:ABC transporter ATP-binding protein [Chryseolinea soli]AYB34108.1 ABC transporter ATP-binding protein [Chryseolinea soli]